LTDEVAEKSDHEEKMMRLSDPAFLKVEVGENDDE
jgi:hypothetical protein